MNVVLTIGFFDGVHIGHRKLINSVIEKAKTLPDCKSIVLTFERVLRSGCGLLTSLEEKIVILKETDIDQIEVIKFDEKFSSITPEDFFYNIIMKKYNTKTMIVGYDFVFGKDRKGSTAILGEMCEKNNMELIVLEPVLYKDTIVSSSYIRKCLMEGRIELVNILLGRDYSIEGEVVKGKGLGKGLGFPTANLKVKGEGKLLPEGVYGGFVSVDNSSYRALINIGSCPTLSAGNVIQPEIHILDFDKEISNKTLKFCFKRKLRDEKKFINIEELKNQIKKDIIFTNA